eukprot:gene26190-34259_t
MSTRLRSKAMSLFLSINWACNLLIGFLTLTAINDLGGVQSDMTDDQTAAAEKKGVAYLYFIFAGFTVLAIAFIHIFVPETKGGMTPGDIQQDETVHEKLITFEIQENIVIHTTHFSKVRKRVVGPFHFGRCSGSIYDISQIDKKKLTASLKFRISPTRSLPENISLSISEVKISYEGHTTANYVCTYSSYLVGYGIENVADNHLVTYFSTSSTREYDPDPWILFDIIGSFADNFVLYNRIQDCCYFNIQYFSVNVYENDSATPLFTYDFNTTSTVATVYNFTLQWKSLEDGSKVFSNYSLFQHDFNSSSQNRQDIFVVYAMNGMQGGTYIDIGANDGVTYSNSYMLEKQFGWSGLLVEPLKWLMPKVYEHRGAKNNILNACVYNRTYLSTFIEVAPSPSHVQELGYGEDMYSGVVDTWSHVNKSWIPDDRVTNLVPCFHAQTILDAYNITHVNYLSVDAEGADEVILRSIDWTRFSADIISFECTEPDIYYRLEQMLYYEREDRAEQASTITHIDIDIDIAESRADTPRTEIVVDSSGRQESS